MVCRSRYPVGGLACARLVVTHHAVASLDQGHALVNPAAQGRQQPVGEDHRRPGCHRLVPLSCQTQPASSVVTAGVASGSSQRVHDADAPSIQIEAVMA